MSDTGDIFAGEQPKKRRKRKSSKPSPMVSEAALEELHATVAGVGLMVASLMPEDKRPLGEEVENMLVPLERIYLRHASLDGVNPDTADALIFVVAFCGWQARVGNFQKLGQLFGRLSRSSRPGRSTAPPSRPVPPQGSHGPAQGGYRTPEEQLATVVAQGITSDEAAEAYQRSQYTQDVFPEPSPMRG